MINYKKIFKSRSLRLKILRLLSFVPDKTMLRMQYFIKTGRKLNLKNPQRFSEKLQWYKLYYKNPLMIQCVDKYDVREYVKSKGLGHILNECYGVFDKPEDIDWDALPQKFVMKDTLGGGGNAVILVKDKSRADIEALKKQAREWVNINAHVRDAGREWPYYSVKNHRIIIEKYIESDAEQGGLIDYKFFVFDGKPVYLYVIADRTLGAGAGLGIYDAEMNRLPVIRVDERPLERILSKPQNYEILRQVAAKLGEDFPEVRIDLYNQDEEILFGEMTFWDGSGYMEFEPDSFDFELASAMKLRTYTYDDIVGLVGGVMSLIITQKKIANHGLMDYKFFCFNGKAEFLYVMGDRKVGKQVRVRLMDREFRRLSVLRVGDEDIGEVEKPQNYLEMLAVTEKLGENFPHVRVDLYNNNGNILFGELTFYNASGYMKYEPDEFDVEMGKIFILKEMIYCDK